MTKKFRAGVLTIERGDILRHPEFGLAQVVELEPERIRIHPYYGPDAGWFSHAEVKVWRDATWKDWDDRGITPLAFAKAMFPENWK